MNKLCDGLYLILKKWSKLGTEDRFSGSFLQIFRLRPLTPCDSAPICSQMERLMEIHNAGKFHRCSICGCQDMYFQRFLKEQKVQFLAASRLFLGHNSLK